MQLIAMHGWAGDSRGWAPLQQACQARGWDLQCGERGYGGLPPLVPSWRPSDPAAARSSFKVVVAHSFGPHLLSAAVLEQADAVVLLASFGRFIPEGRGGRTLRSALAAMAEQLQGPAAAAMLKSFLAKAAAPADPALLPEGPAHGELTAQGKARLGADLAALGNTTHLPAGFPTQARVLLVEAGADQIVAPEATRALAASLPQADRLELQGAGHCLLGTAALPMVLAWLENLG
jgi:pimeloyl-[acyl-carrier protein] methyl ester esterase